VTVLAIETSSRSGSVAVRHGGRTVERALENARAHASDLVPALDALLAPLGLGAGRLGELEAIVVGTGPGSFTGLRVGVATALGLARGAADAGACPRLRGVPSFEASAAAALAPGEVGTVLADARAGRVYVARYERTADDVRELRPPAALFLDELAPELAAEGALLADERTAELLRLDPARRRPAPPPRASVLLDLGLHRLAASGPHAPGELRPLYLQAFGARAAKPGGDLS